MENGFMGEFAKEKITSAIQYMNGIITDKEKSKKKKPSEVKLIKEEPKAKESQKINWTKELLRSLIDMIGEPLIKDSMNDLFYKVFFDSYDDIDNEILRLERLRNMRLRKLKQLNEISNSN